jgi:hypothetical protein
MAVMFPTRLAVWVLLWAGVTFNPYSENISKELHKYHLGDFTIHKAHLCNGCTDKTFI